MNLHTDMYLAQPTDYSQLEKTEGFSNEKTGKFSEDGEAANCKPPAEETPGLIRTVNHPDKVSVFPICAMLQ